MEKLVRFATKIVLLNSSVRTGVERTTKNVSIHQPVIIDREVFKKSDEEKAELKRLKRAYKKSTPQEREEFLGHFIKAKMPNWNLSFILTK